MPRTKGATKHTAVPITNMPVEKTTARKPAAKGTSRALGTSARITGGQQVWLQGLSQLEVLQTICSNAYIASLEGNSGEVTHYMQQFNLAITQALPVFQRISGQALVTA